MDFVPWPNEEEMTNERNPPCERGEISIRIAHIPKTIHRLIMVNLLQNILCCCCERPFACDIRYSLTNGLHFVFDWENISHRKQWQADDGKKATENNENWLVTMNEFILCRMKRTKIGTKLIHLLTHTRECWQSIEFTTTTQCKFRTRFEFDTKAQMKHEANRKKFQSQSEESDSKKKECQLSWIVNVFSLSVVFHFVVLVRCSWAASALSHCQLLLFRFHFRCITTCSLLSLCVASIRCFSLRCFVFLLPKKKENFISLFCGKSIVIRRISSPAFSCYVNLNYKIRLYVCFATLKAFDSSIFFVSLLSGAHTLTHIQR